MNRVLALLIVSATALAVAADGPAATSGSTPVAPGSGAASSGGGGLQMIALPVLILGVMYFLLIRPQRKEEKKRKELISALKRGDRVVTIGGLHGEVVAVGETTVDLLVGKSGSEVTMTFNRGAINANLEQAKAESK
ncbi:MAG: preprotein translocase subunit YajC [Planctomycetes bacterium]|nr:preprotein translocase subunit YajC [Planctomycetota bacterium]